MLENRPTGFEYETKKPLPGFIYKLLPLATVLVVLAVLLCFGTLHSNENAETESESGAYVIQGTVAIPAGPMDGIPDDEITTAFAPNFHSNYLSGALPVSINTFTPVDSYIEMKSEQEITNRELPETSGYSEETAAASEPETEQESETTPEETQPEPSETDTEPETTALPEDPRETVWSHYPNLGVVVAPNYLHIRTAPSLEGEIVGILFNMSGVDLLEVSGDGLWYHIISNGIEGYINAEFVVTGEEARALAYEYAFAAVTVKAEVLNVRQEPNTDSTILTQIIAGSLYAVSEETNEDWLKIVIGSDIEGYVAREFVTYDYALQDAVAYTPEPEEVVPSINPVRLDIVNNAMQYLGGTYVWGGTTLGVGVDCSGFMLRLFEQYGYNLPRTSYWQVGSGVPVSFEEMQPGDLIFYWNNSLGRVGHVALYMGNNLIIHAASEQRGIVIDDYRFMTPYCARNIIGD